MPFYTFDNGQIDISNIVQRETVQFNATLSVDVDARGGESTLQCNIVVNPSTDYLPLAGNILTWVGDDGFNLTYFSGIITDVTQIHAGFNENNERVVHYEVSARDPSVLLEKKLVEPGIYNQKWTEGATDPDEIPSSVTGNARDGFTVSIRNEQHRWPDFIGNNPGELLDLLAIAGEMRLGLPTDNDNAATDDFILPYNYEIARVTYKDAIDQLAREAGLLWWIDAEWNFHHKSFPKIYNTLQDPYFDITDDVTNLNYYGLEIREDIEKWVSRVKVIGNVHDAGDENQENRRQGKQKREEVVVTVTSSLENINTIRRRLGYEELPENTNVDELSDIEPGIWITAVPAPDVYLQKESGDPDPTQPDYSLLKQIGEAYLLRYGQPDIVGSVFFNNSPPKVGASLVIDTPSRGYTNLQVPVVEVVLESSGQDQGQDELCNRKYVYRCQFRGPSMRQRYSRLVSKAEVIKARPERLLKPNPPVIRGSSVFAESTGEVLSQMQVAQTVTAVIITPNYSVAGTPYGTINDEYPAFNDGAPNPVQPPVNYEQPKNYYPPIKKPWTITSGFGTRTHPVTGTTSDHPALDIAAKEGTPIYSIWDGTVAVAENNPNVNLAGKYIKINHTDGAQTTYAHLSKIIIKKGQEVKRGQIIGYTGKTGRVTGPHLHFGIKKNGVSVNPNDFKYVDDREQS